MKQASEHLGARGRSPKVVSKGDPRIISKCEEKAATRKDFLMNIDWLAHWSNNRGKETGLGSVQCSAKGIARILSFPFEDL